jgi:hypothetical protein
LLCTFLICLLQLFFCVPSPFPHKPQEKPCPLGSSIIFAARSSSSLPIIKGYMIFGRILEDKTNIKNIFPTVYHLFITINCMSSPLMGLKCIIVFIALLAKVTKKSRRSFTMDIFYVSLAMTLVGSKASATQTTFKAEGILYYVVKYLVICALQEWITHEDTYKSIQQICAVPFLMVLRYFN